MKEQSSPYQVPYVCLSVFLLTKGYSLSLPNKCFIFVKHIWSRYYLFLLHSIGWSVGRREFQAFQCSDFFLNMLLLYVYVPCYVSIFLGLYEIIEFSSPLSSILFTCCQVNWYFFIYSAILSACIRFTFV